tara:strand:- start:859 stop:1059 length:201 start_codon:yes stop_codon:yes gene_type:complete
MVFWKKKIKKKKKAKPIELPQELLITEKHAMHYDNDDFSKDLDIITNRLKNVDISEYRLLERDSDS